MLPNKNKKKDAPKEQLIEGVALSDNELEKVSGGDGGGQPMSPDRTTCPFNNYVASDVTKPQCCANCNHYDFETMCCMDWERHW